MKKEMKRRSGCRIMASLAGLVRPLLPIMCLAILLGVLGYLCAIFLTIFAAYGVIHVILASLGADLGQAGSLLGLRLPVLFLVLILMAVFRGIFHYGEQYCNHFIAFKLLAIVRHKVFAKLRVLCPAKLEGRDKGDLIALITSDIELLEVFYAHTISPMAIAFLTSVIMLLFIGSQSLMASVLALLGYLTVGVFIPLWNGARGAKAGLAYRQSFGELNSYVLESLYGLDETLQYGFGEKRNEAIRERSFVLGELQKKLSRLEGSQRSLTNLAIQLFSLAMLCLTVSEFFDGYLVFSQILIATVAMMGSFGPVVALSNLSNNLNQTLACGERVLNLLSEEPMTEELKAGEDCSFEGAEFREVGFAYEKEKILDGFSMKLEKGKIIGIHGASGSGKSTLLKLLMRFWDVDDGSVRISGKDIRTINTSSLREMEAYVTQETWLFDDTIAKNIAVGKQNATLAEIQEAAKKASIHDFIMQFPKGYETRVGELGSRLSGGERQRIGVARAFLHGGRLLLLDEPTSNLDSLNEGVILKALKEAYRKETVVLVSHRDSTMSIADHCFEMESGRIS